MNKLSLTMKLNLICIGLVIFPMVLLGALALRSIASFSGEVTEMASERLTADAEKILLAGSGRDRDEILGFIRMIESDTIKMAGSGILMTYLETLNTQGQSDDTSVEIFKMRLQQDLLQISRIAKVMTPSGEKPAYPQVRLLDAKGREMVAVVDGHLRPDQDLQTRQGVDWFEEARKLAAGSVFVSQVQIARNTGEPEIRVSSPVYLNNVFRGVVVINADWRLAWELLSNNTYGHTGYSYILNEKGTLLSHPDFTLKDNVNLSDSRHGELGELVRSKMLLGMEGVTGYEYEGAMIYASFTPLKLGRNNYVVATQVPMQEVLEIENEIHKMTAFMVKGVIRTNISIFIVLSVLGSMVGIFFSRSIARPINSVVTGLNDGAEQVASASDEVSLSSQAMAEGASQQAASIEETSASMEEMSSMTRKNAQNAMNAAKLMREVTQEVDVANDSMMQLSRSMGEITKASEEISKVVRSIDEIAFQTNLLALNAAVEAARAGEAGAGFAVVADEVRNLALRAADSAKETAQLIEGTVQKINFGSKLVFSTSEAFENVMNSSGKVGRLMDEISNASNEQSNGITQVNIAISEMDKVIQQNAASAEESASAAEEMSAQAEQLKEYVGELVLMMTGRKVVSEAGNTFNDTMKFIKSKPRDFSSILDCKTRNSKDSRIPFFDGNEGSKDFA